MHDVCMYRYNAFIGPLKSAANMVIYIWNLEGWVLTWRKNMALGRARRNSPHSPRKTFPEVLAHNSQQVPK